MISQGEMNRLVEAGHYSLVPEYRLPTCACCGKPQRGKVWHVFLKEFGNKRELHLCLKCGIKYGIQK